MITCADRSTLMAGLIKLPHILGFKFISPRLLGPVIGFTSTEPNHNYSNFNSMETNDPEKPYH